MNEVEWLACPDPRPLIGFLRGRLGHRKGRLFAVACCRLVTHLYSGPESVRAVEVAERYADGLATDDERAGAWPDLDERLSRSDRPRDAGWWADSAAGSALVGVAPDDSWHKMAAEVSREVVTAWPASVPAQLALFHCIVGNPFRPAVADPAWLTPTVRAVAGGIYADRAFDRLPVLADALEDAGCENARLLAHCRGEGPHARGCWVVDALLEKT